MSATQIAPGKFEIKINGELCVFTSETTGISLLREKHSGKFFSYEDLVAMADKQLNLFPLPEPKPHGQ